MYRIGEFASMTELTKETLRYYADIKLLEPVYVDPVNQYKYYDNGSYLMARLLFYLRRFGFTIREMKDFVEKRSLDDLEDILQEKKRKLYKQVEEITAVIQDIDAFIDNGNGVGRND
ncbi:MerR family transcriptional regulator [Paenibacillus arenilitoris]|uniref:MerR family transcriptional regulator n=1 Tax=Paenibacillus arenilitoris TaxID=2772299 RepID=A0A927H4V2_9BACL|nr:MerR family transcriptional regulator [Paenibacillus arenilitoris]MBD2868265.1 MerR family transcriptional regulator [Paenibacillus arenilitoris]